MERDKYVSATITPNTKVEIQMKDAQSEKLGTGNTNILLRPIGHSGGDPDKEAEKAITRCKKN